MYQIVPWYAWSRLTSVCFKLPPSITTLTLNNNLFVRSWAFKLVNAKYLLATLMKALPQYGLVG